MLPLPKHDVTVMTVAPDQTLVTIYTYQEDPTFTMSFSSIIEVSRWRDHITEEINRDLENLKKPDHEQEYR